LDVEMDMNKDPLKRFEILKRIFSWVLVQGFATVGEYEMPFVEENPEVIKWQTVLLGKTANFAVDTDRSSVSQVAVIFDEKCMFYGSYQMRSHPIWIALNEFLIYELTNTGTPYDIFLLSDLDNPEIPDYKVYIFMNPFRLTVYQRKAINEKVKKKGKVAVWLYAPGLLNEKGISTDNIYDITEIRLVYEEIKEELKVKITDFNHSLTKGLSEDLIVGGKYRKHSPGLHSWESFVPPASLCGPVFFSIDKTAAVLGNMMCNSRPGFVVKSFPDWTSIWLGVTSIPADLLRNIFKYAGVHVYSDTNEALYVNKSWLSIHTREAGERVIKLPERMDVYDVFANQLVGEKISEFKVSLPKHITKLYYLGEYKKIKGSALEAIAGDLKSPVEPVKVRCGTERIDFAPE